MFFNRMSDDGGGDCSIFTRVEVGRFFILLVAGKMVFLVIIGKRDMVEVDYTKQIFSFLSR